jgi:hypothetical protein
MSNVSVDVREEKFRRLLSLLLDEDPLVVLDKLRVISLVVFYGVQMGLSDDEIIKMCLREIGGGG